MQTIPGAAKDLARNPLGIVALFIVLVYGIAALALGLTSSLTPDERVPLVWFLVIFPALVLGVFCWLVSGHHEKLYAPGDYKSDEGFLSAAQATRRTLVDLQEHQAKVKETVRATLQRSGTAAQAEELIRNVEQQIEEATTLTVDASDFTGDPEKKFKFPIIAFDTIGALTNEVFFRLKPHVGAYEYGYSWVLRNVATNQVVETSRMITRSPPGRPIADRRTLQQVGVGPGVTLRVERPN